MSTMRATSIPLDADVFARTYRQATAVGTYVKTMPEWAEQAQRAGSVETREGVTHYEAGDYLVSNQSDGSGEYAVGVTTFESLYTPDP